jgi:hypothetical protein
MQTPRVLRRSMNELFVDRRGDVYLFLFSGDFGVVWVASNASRLFAGNARASPIDALPCAGRNDRICMAMVTSWCCS